MAIKSYKAYTPSRRQMTITDYSGLTKKKPEKRLSGVINERSGRNSQGRVTVRHQGGRHPRKYRMIDFRQNKFGISGKIVSVEYDPNRSAFVSLVQFKDGEKRYILAPEGISTGRIIEWSKVKIEAQIGNRMPLEFIPDGTIVHNVEMHPGKGGQVVRSAGSGATVMTKEGKYVQLKMPSGEIRNYFKDCAASIGQLSNTDHFNVVLGKAGRSRWQGIRPTVLGTSMNAVDHPHGGGKAHQSIGLRKGPRTPWGKIALGVPTRKRNKASNKFIIKPHKVRK